MPRRRLLSPLPGFESYRPPSTTGSRPWLESDHPSRGSRHRLSTGLVQLPQGGKFPRSNFQISSNLQIPETKLRTRRDTQRMKRRATPRRHGISIDERYVWGSIEGRAFPRPSLFGLRERRSRGCGSGRLREALLVIRSRRRFRQPIPLFISFSKIQGTCPSEAQWKH